MKLTRPLLFLDLESTGTDICKDRIVELGVTVLHPDGSVKPRGWSQRFNPGIPIPAEASAVHGITDADVAGKPPFLEIAPILVQRFVGKDLAGYNLRRFDLPLLDEELRRCGFYLDLRGVAVIDVAGIFFKKEARNLDAAVERYCGRKRGEEGHSAGIDAADTLEVFQGQMMEYAELDEMEADGVANFSLMANRKPADIAGKLFLDEEGVLCYGFGKVDGTRVRDDPSYGKWMLTKDFPGSTLDLIRAEMEGH